VDEIVRRRKTEADEFYGGSSPVSYCGRKVDPRALAGML
jgi:hypothetical protein